MNPLPQVKHTTDAEHEMRAQGVQPGTIFEQRYEQGRLIGLYREQGLGTQHRFDYAERLTPASYAGLLALQPGQTEQSQHTPPAAVQFLPVVVQNGQCETAGPLQTTPEQARRVLLRHLEAGIRQRREHGAPVTSWESSLLNGQVRPDDAHSWTQFLGGVQDTYGVSLQVLSVPLPEMVRFSLSRTEAPGPELDRAVDVPVPQPYSVTCRDNSVSVQLEDPNGTQLASVMIELGANGRTPVLYAWDGVNGHDNDPRVKMDLLLDTEEIADARNH